MKEKIMNSKFLNNSTTKTFLKGFLFLNLLAVLLAISCSIPTKYVQKNILSYAEMYERQAQRHTTYNNYIGSICDTIADSQTLGIIYNGNSLFDPVYCQDNNYVTYFTKLLKQNITEGIEPNTSYARYWHGFRLFITPMLTVMTVDGIRMVFLSIWIILNAILVMALVKKKMFKLLISYILAISLSTFYFCFTSLSFIPVAILMTLGCIHMVLTKKEDNSLFFFLMGILVAFFDFLTAEIVTLGMPLAFLIAIKKDNIKFLSYTKYIIWWSVGYVGSFLYRFVLIVLFTGHSFSYAVGDTLWGHFNKYNVSRAFLSNINVLFPNVNEYGKSLHIFLITAITIALFTYLFRKKDYSDKQYVMMILLATVPYLRYYVLSGHAVIHYWMTYRNQIIAIFVGTNLLLNTVFVDKVTEIANIQIKKIIKKGDAYVKRTN